MTMTDIQTQGGFAGDPAAALDVAGTSGCCGNPPTATLTLPDPGQSVAAGASPCCGTAADAAVAGACCGASAKAEAVASGAGCCG
jgi:hypothetical protein